MISTYDIIGINYAELRKPDHRIASIVESALGSAQTVLNVGAGTGSYEPTDRSLIAVEPSREMIRKRNPAAVYELALQSGRPYQPGDQISYYVTGRGKRVKVHETARLASQWDRRHPDENVEYYKAKLLELYKKFKPFIRGIGGPRGDSSE